MKNVKFIKLTAAKSAKFTKKPYEASKHQGIFVHLTEDVVNNNVTTPAGLYFGGAEGWELLSTEVSLKGVRSASISDNGVVSFKNRLNTELFTLTLAKVAKTGAAVDITISDTAGKITATTVEGALAELATTIASEETNRKAQIGDLGKVSAIEGAADHTVKSYVDAKISDVNGAASTLEDRVAAAEDRVAAAEGRLNTIEGEGEGSIKKAAANAVAAVVAGANSDFDTLKEVADWIANDTTGAAAMQTAIATLNGGVSKDGSVAKALEDAKESILGGAGGEYNTLKKLENKIKTLDGVVYTGVENASADQFVKVSEISDKKQTLSVTVGEFNVDESGNIPATATTFVKTAGLATIQAVGDVILANEKITAAALESLNERLDVIEGADTVSGSVAKAIKDTKDELKGSSSDTKDSETIAGAKKYADSIFDTLDVSTTTVTGDTADALTNTGVNVVVKVTDSVGEDSNDHAYKVSATAEMVWLDELPA